jgi:hypothetical protein
MPGASIRNVALTLAIGFAPCKSSAPHHQAIVDGANWRAGSGADLCSVTRSDRPPEQREPLRKLAAPKLPRNAPARRRLAHGTHTQVLFNPLIHAPVLAPELAQGTGGFAGGSQSMQ